MKKVLLLIFCVSILLLAGFFMANKKEIKTIRFDSGTEVQVEVVKNLKDQAKGLSGRKELKEGTGMLFVYKDEAERNFWMKEMQFAIDIIWIRNGQVVGFVQDASPDTGQELEIYSSPEAVDQVLEVPSGFVEKEGIEMGEKVEIK